MSALDPSYALDHAPFVAAHARALRRPQRVIHADEDLGTRTLRLELRVRGMDVTYIGTCPARMDPDKARTEAIVYVARTDRRMRELVRATPDTPPEWQTKYDAEGRETLGGQYAWKMAAWARRYICQTDAPGRPRGRHVPLR